MKGLFLLTALSYLPIDAGIYTNAAKTSRDAAFLQSGLKQEWDDTTSGAIKQAPSALKNLAPVAGSLYYKKIELRTTHWGMYYVQPGYFKAEYSIPF